MRTVKIYDTTLRDGAQSEEINLTPEDKVRIARKLDGLGVHYVEGGWPGSNPTDRAFFQEIGNYELKHSRIAAFGSTHNPKTPAGDDPNLAALIESGAPVLTIFGKTWDFHVTEALRIGLDDNLRIIESSLARLRPHCDELFYDCEHFFDGFFANPDYAVRCVRTALAAGADAVVLCDTNGGRLPHEIGEAIGRLKAEIPDLPFGIHTHNDSETAVAGAVEAVRLGARQVQGTVNGYGERCGNANLCSIIPILELKLGVRCIGEERLKLLTEASHYVAEMANLRPFLRQPFVGRAAFAHKGGIHVSAVLRSARTYEHIDPEEVGNLRRVLLSDMSGRSNILFKAKNYGYDLNKDDPAVQDILAEIKERERMGYEYSVAEASFELLFFKAMGWSKRYFHFLHFSVMDAKREKDEEPISEATVIVKVRGEEEHTAASGNGPVNALDRALRKALVRFYPAISEIKLLDFKVRVLSAQNRKVGGTASYVRVLIESGDGRDRWTTVGVSHNIIEASWQALVDAVNYKLFKDDPKKWPYQKGEED